MQKTTETPKGTILPGRLSLVGWASVSSRSRQEWLKGLGPRLQPPILSGGTGNGTADFPPGQEGDFRALPPPMRSGSGTKLGQRQTECGVLTCLLVEGWPSPARGKGEGPF